MWKGRPSLPLLCLQNARPKVGTTVCPNQLGRRNVTVVSLFWEFRGLKQLLCHPKTGRKLLLGQKFTQMDLRIFQNAGQKQRSIQDLVI